MSQNEAVLIKKTIDAPSEVVWDAWADPVKLATWWRLSSVKRTVITEYDFRPGGSWRQHAIDNNDLAIGEHNPGVMFEQIVPQEKIVTVPKPIEGESVEVVPGLEKTIIAFERVGDNKTQVSLKVSHDGPEDWRPNELVQSVYDEVFDGLEKFVRNLSK